MDTLLWWCGAGVVIGALLQRKYQQIGLRFCPDCRQDKELCGAHWVPWFLLGFLLPPLGVGVWFIADGRYRILVQQEEAQRQQKLEKDAEQLLNLR